MLPSSRASTQRRVLVAVAIVGAVAACALATACSPEVGPLANSSAACSPADAGSYANTGGAYATCTATSSPDAASGTDPRADATSSLDPDATSGGGLYPP